MLGRADEAKAELLPIMVYSAMSDGYPGGGAVGGSASRRFSMGTTVVADNAENLNKSGRLGNQSTRDHVFDVATEMEKRGWTITHGGGRASEEYLPGPGGTSKGSSYPDITATKNGRTLRVNTVDTRVDGVTLSKREATNAARIRAQTGEHLLTIPKPKP